MKFLETKKWNHWEGDVFQSLNHPKVIQINLHPEKFNQSKIGFLSWSDLDPWVYTLKCAFYFDWGITAV